LNVLRKVSLYIVNKTIRTFGVISFRTEATTKPFARGIAKSRRIKSGFSSRLFSMVSSPANMKIALDQVIANGLANASAVVRDENPLSQSISSQTGSREGRLRVPGTT
jgi:hypothetical protein